MAATKARTGLFQQDRSRSLALPSDPATARRRGEGDEEELNTVLNENASLLLFFLIESQKKTRLHQGQWRNSLDLTKCEKIIYK